MISLKTYYQSSTCVLEIIVLYSDTHCIKYTIFGDMFYSYNIKPYMCLYYMCIAQNLSVKRFFKLSQLIFFFIIISCVLINTIFYQRLSMNNKYLVVLSYNLNILPFIYQRYFKRLILELSRMVFMRN